MTRHWDYERADGVMIHPCDSEAWKHFDRVHPDFSKEPRNVRLGLCTDGFNPFGQVGKAYSCWPVILTPYNPPPPGLVYEAGVYVSHGLNSRRSISGHED